MPWPVHPNGLLGAQGDNDTYKIERSLRFNSADSAYLSRTPASTTNRKTWTYSTWIKRTKLSSASTIFFGWNGSNTSTVFQFTSTDNLELYNFAGAYYAPRLITNQVLRDVSAWYHIVLVWDADNATSADRQRIYINGVRVTSFSTESYSNDIAYGINVASYPHGIGGGVGSDFDGYMTEIYFIDGQALTPSSFGETDAITGRWKAKAYSGTYGTNGFYLNFADNSNNTATTLGKDSSPNGNNWTPNNFSITAGEGNDSLVDSPANYGTDAGVGGEVRGNYCTLNPLDSGTVTLANGNLDVSFGTSARGIRSSIGISSGKYYFEMTVGVFGSNGPAVGIAYQNANISSNYAGSDANAWVYNGGDGKIYNNNAGTGSNATYTNNDIIGVAVNMDNGTVTFYKNNSVQPTTVSGLSGTVFPVVTSGGVAGVQYLNFGQRPFAYTAPTGFKALCTTNLTQPTIQKPSKYMDVVAYTGTGASNSISSLGFSPDLVWIKNRGGATSHAIYDTTRLATKQLSSDTTGDEATSSTGLTAFGSNGFTIGTSTLVNTSGTQYVSWAWDEATISGMDIVGYTGTGSNMTISHSLGVTPKMIINKLRSGTGGWPVYHVSLGNTGAVQLESTGAFNVSSTYWNNTSPTSSNFTVAAGLAVNGATYINYVFAEVEGFSKFGSYTGNASADGPFIYCGFRPKLIIGKRTDAVENWIIYDTSRDSFNVASAQLQPNTSIAELTANALIDFNSNGFKFRSTNSFNGNSAGGTHIFAAFAESPFKYARAR